MALNVGRVEHCSVGRLGTEATSGLLAVVDEILTPNLDGGVTIFGAVSGIECVDTGKLIVVEASLVNAVGEITSDGDLDRNLFV